VIQGKKVMFCDCVCKLCLV